MIRLSTFLFGKSYTKPPDLIVVAEVQGISVAGMK